MYWYEDEVKRLEQERQSLTQQPKTLFYGSSSIRLWASLKADLPALEPANLGFGGSTLAACVWFFDRIMAGYQPERLIVYAGDNDLGDGRNPEEVFIFFQQLMVRARERFGNLPCYFVSLKPSPSRWNLANQFRYANELIEKEITLLDANWKYIDIYSTMLNASGKPDQQCYGPDGLHMTEEGYRRWTEVIGKFVSSS